MDYTKLAYIVTRDTVTYETREQHYKRHRALLNDGNIELMNAFQRDEFCLSGTVHLMPEFMVSENARENLIYPQGFLFLEADKDYYTRRSYVDSYELRFTLSGRGYLEYMGKSYTLEAGQGYFIDCRVPHYYRTDGTHWNSTCLHFSGKPVAPVFRAYTESGNLRFSDTVFPNMEMMQMQILHAAIEPSPYAEYKISALFTLLLSELLVLHSKSMSSERIPEIIEHVLSYMQTNYGDTFTIDDLAHRFGISRTHLTRKFREYTGFSPHDFLQKIRINKAKELLSTTSYSVEEVAARTGFRDTAYFISVFKKSQKVTPLKYRKGS